MESPSPVKKEERGSKKAEKKAEAKKPVPEKLPAPINVTVSGELHLKGSNQQPEGGNFLQHIDWGVVVVTGVLVIVTARLVADLICFGFVRYTDGAGHPYETRFYRTYVVGEEFLVAKDDPDYDDSGARKI